jgi:hypothetical protein
MFPVITLDAIEPMKDMHDTIYRPKRFIALWIDWPNAAASHERCVSIKP